MNGHLFTKVLGCLLIALFAVSASCGMSKKKILIMVTSEDAMETGHKTGYWGEELVVPYDLFRSAGFNVVISSPKGGVPPVDAVSIDPNYVKKEIADKVEGFIASHTEELSKSPKLAEIDPGEYDAVFVVGGHGAVWDLVVDKDANRIIQKLYNDGKIVSAVCHGPSAFVNIRRDDGKTMLDGHEVAGFSAEEETAAGLAEYVSRSNLNGQLEDRLKNAGAIYKHGPMWASFYTVSGNVITGQNPASSEATAKAVINSLSPRMCGLLKR